MKRFCDRMFVEVNGTELAYVKTANVRRTQNVSRADHMTRDRRTSGFKYGNLGVSGSIALDIAQNKAQVDLALANPDAEVNLVAIVGVERYTVLGVVEADMDLNGSVGDAGKTINFEAKDIVNENGESVNVELSI